MMNRLKLFTILLALVPAMLSGQTTLDGGTIDGPLTKAKSPYRVTKTIEVAQGKTLHIEPGVRLEFGPEVNLNVYGSIQAIGTNQDSIVFTAIDTANGWKGIKVFKNQASADSNLFAYCEFSHTYQITPDAWRDFGAVLLDTVDNVRFSYCLFVKNIAFNAAGIRAFYSKLTIDNCTFLENQAYDPGVASPTNTDGPGMSCIASKFSELNLIQSTFRGNNSTAPNYKEFQTRKQAIAVVAFNGNKVKIKDCLFDRNHADAGRLILYTGSYFPKLKLDTFWFNNNVVTNNSIYEGPILQLNGEASEHVRFYVTNCDFIENRNITSDQAKGDVIMCYNSNGGGNDMLIDRCRLINNAMYNGISSNNRTYVKVSNTIITGQRGFAFSCYLSSNTFLTNCLLVNNWSGIITGYNAELHVVNSSISHNGRIDTTLPYPVTFSGDEPFTLSNGIYVSDRGKINLYNCIITGNRGHLGQMANIVGINRSLFGGNLHNCILEGGVDSTYRQGISAPWGTSGKMIFSNVYNVHDQAPSFINPPLGVGVDYYRAENDYRVKVTCDTSRIFNQGDRFPSIPYDFYPRNEDYAGNPRKMCGQVDIGPYEETGPAGYTYLEMPWNDTMLCSNQLASFNPKVCGNAVDYQWQYSTDKNNWTTLKSDAFDKNVLDQPKSGYYQVFTHQKQCNVYDTFGPTQLRISPAPTPWLGNDTILYVNDTLYLNPGHDYAKYQWNTPSPNTEKQVQITGYKYRKWESQIFWCEVTTDSGCVARDSILIYFHDWTAGAPQAEMLQVSLYPNPATEVLEIHLPNPAQENIQVALSNQLGQQLDTKTIHPGSQNLVWDIKTLPVGTYYVNITYRGKTQVQKLLKVK